MKRRALVSVSDKMDVVSFSAGLVKKDFEIVSTSGTAGELEAGGVSITQVSIVTAFPEILDGRVKTLHPAIHAGILARRDNPEDMATLARLGIVPIELVAVNLYPFEETAAIKDVEFEKLNEQIDIGGPSLLRAAAKNFRDVWVVVNPSDYYEVLNAIDDEADGRRQLEFRYELARKAFYHTAQYDNAISLTLNKYGPNREGKFVRTFRGR